MSNKIEIETPEGTVSLDADLLKGYKAEAFEILAAEASAKKNFKEAVEAQAEALGIEKKYLSKYFKVSYKQQTAEQAALAEMYSALDDATEEVLAVSGE